MQFILFEKNYRCLFIPNCTRATKQKKNFRAVLKNIGTVPRFRSAVPDPQCPRADYGLAKTKQKVIKKPYNKLLTNRASPSCTGEYWPSVVFVWTWLRSVRTATTSGQYSPVRPSRSVSKKLLKILLLIIFLRFQIHPPPPLPREFLSRSYDVWPYGISFF